VQCSPWAYSRQVEGVLVLWQGEGHELGALQGAGGENERRRQLVEEGQELLHSAPPGEVQEPQEVQVGPGEVEWQPCWPVATAAQAVLEPLCEAEGDRELQGPSAVAAVTPA
jgi:hypothetical protein